MTDFQHSLAWCAFGVLVVTIILFGLIMRLLPGTNKVPLPEELCDIYRMWLSLEDGFIYSVAHVSNDVMASIKGHESIVAPDITRGPPKCFSVFREPDGSRKLVLHPVPDKEYYLIVRYTVVKEL